MTLALALTLALKPLTLISSSSQATDKLIQKFYAARPKNAGPSLIDLNTFLAVASEQLLEAQDVTPVSEVFSSTMVGVRHHRKAKPTNPTILTTQLNLTTIPTTPYHRS